MTHGPLDNCPATFLGTGNFFAKDRYWNSFVLDGHILVEPSPIALPHLRRCGFEAVDLDVVVISHFHADHTFGWPFLLLELLGAPSPDPLFIVGPPGVAAFLEDMLRVAGLPGVAGAAAQLLDIRFVEVNGDWQQAGSLRFRGVEVEHVPHLACYGYLFDCGDRVIGYSGDTKPCPGLDSVAAASDVLIVECNGEHPPPVTHMDVTALEELQARHPSLPLVLTHLGVEPDLVRLSNARVPKDFETLEL